jgi:ubiquinone biosynthesis protein COQ9
MDIEKVCDAIGYSQDLISFSLNDKDVDQKTFKRNILEDDLTDEEKEKQEVLEGLCELAKKEGFSEKYLEQSKSLGLQDAYDVLQDMYLSEI